MKLEYHGGPTLERKARYLQSIACLVKDAAKHDELMAKAQALIDKAVRVRLRDRAVLFCFWLRISIYIISILAMSQFATGCNDKTKMRPVSSGEGINIIYSTEYICGTAVMWSYSPRIDWDGGTCPRSYGLRSWLVRNKRSLVGISFAKELILGHQDPVLVSSEHPAVQRVFYEYADIFSHGSADIFGPYFVFVGFGGKSWLRGIDSFIDTVYYYPRTFIHAKGVNALHQAVTGGNRGGFGGIGSFSGCTRLANVHYQQSERDTYRQIFKNLFPKWGFVFAPVGLFLMWIGWSDIRQDVNLRWGMTSFFSGCILWMYGFARLITL